MATGRTDAPLEAEDRPKRRRLPGVNLRSGAVRQARLEAGLSLAQLGKGHVTAPAIYLVETGRTRPSLPTLEHIARRTGKPVEFFLAEPHGPVDQAAAALPELEGLVHAKRYTEAIALGESVVAGSALPVRLGRIRYLLAYAYRGAGRLEAAAGSLAEAKAHFEALKDAAMLASCLATEAEFLLETNPAAAVELAKSAISVARALSPGPLIMAARLRGVLADALAATGQHDEAIAAYLDAVKFTEPVFDLGRAARTYRALGVAFREAGDLEAATWYSMRAVTLFEIVGGQEAVIRWERSLGRELIARGDAAEARSHFARGLELLDRGNLDSGRSAVLLGLCELAMRDGDVDQAAALASDALAAASRLDDSAGAAEAHVWLGRVADKRGDHAAADREFESAIRGFEALGKRERLLQSHGAYAEILERRGELARAYKHMKEALQASRPGRMRPEQDEERVSSA